MMVRLLNWRVHQKPLEAFVSNSGFWDPCRISDSESLNWNWGVQISNKFPGDAVASSSGPTLWESLSKWKLRGEKKARGANPGPKHSSQLLTGCKTHGTAFYYCCLQLHPMQQLAPFYTEGCSSPRGTKPAQGRLQAPQCPVSRASHCSQIPLSSQAHFTGISLVCTQVLVERNETHPKTKGKKADLMQNLPAFQKLSRWKMKPQVWPLRILISCKDELESGREKIP